MPLVRTGRFSFSPYRSCCQMQSPGLRCSTGRGFCLLEYRTVLEIVVISVAMLGVASGAVVWLVREAARDRRARQSERRRHF